VTRSTARILLAACAAVLFAAGCSVNTTFVYKPSPPAAGVRKLPVKVAVLPFADGTEDFTKQGSVFAPENLYYNLAKAGWGGVITALTPDLWAKALADDLAASDAFRSARFVFAPEEAAGEDFRIEGTVEKATLAGGFGQPNEFALHLRAIRRDDARPAWNLRVSRKWVNRKTLYDGCGAMSVGCMVERHHADTNRAMRELFAEARDGLVRALTPGGEGEPAVPDAAEPKPGSVDGTIEKILRGP
jgi:hypothetical protein